MQITRRRFVTGLSAPLILGAQDKSGAKPPVLGQGDQKYEWIDNWGQKGPKNTHPWLANTGPSASNAPLLSMPAALPWL